MPYWTIVGNSSSDADEICQKVAHFKGRVNWREGNKICYTVNHVDGTSLVLYKQIMHLGVYV
jgi:hypothetical protein